MAKREKELTFYHKEPGSKATIHTTEKPCLNCQLFGTRNDDMTSEVSLDHFLSFGNVQSEFSIEYKNN